MFRLARVDGWRIPPHRTDYDPLTCWNRDLRFRTNDDGQAVLNPTEPTDQPLIARTRQLLTLYGEDVVGTVLDDTPAGTEPDGV